MSEETHEETYVRQPASGRNLRPEFLNMKEGPMVTLDRSTLISRHLVETVLRVSSFAFVIKLRKGKYFVKLNTCQN